MTLNNGLEWMVYFKKGKCRRKFVYDFVLTQSLFKLIQWCLETMGHKWSGYKAKGTPCLLQFSCNFAIIFTSSNFICFKYWRGEDEKWKHDFFLALYPWGQPYLDTQDYGYCLRSFVPLTNTYWCLLCIWFWVRCLEYSEAKWWSNNNNNNKTLTLIQFLF